MILRIKDWDKHYETHKTRIVKKDLKFIKLPVKDGLGSKRLKAHPNGAAHMGVWASLLQLASGCEKRGTFARDGVPHSEDDIAVLVGFPGAIVKEAISRLSSPQIGWLEYVDFVSGEQINHMAVRGANPAQPGAPPPDPALQTKTETKTETETETKTETETETVANEIPLDDSPFETIDGTPLAVIDRNHPSAILTELEGIYLRAGKPVSESHKAAILGYLFDINPPENRHRVTDYVKKCAAREPSCADLGAAQILERGDGLLARGGCLAKRLEPLRVLFMAAVREIEARDVHSGADELLQRLPRIAGRPDGAYDFGSTIEQAMAV